MVLRQEGEDATALDGMDIAVCRFDLKNQLLEYAGAINPVYVCRDGEIIELKADMIPVGGKHQKTKHVFNLQQMQLMPKDAIYLFSDGLADQFGGEQRRKYGYKRFQDLLRSIQLLPMSEQRIVIERAIENWKGEQPQLDDILVMGLKI